ncbi:MAG: HTH-type transcriptional regulator LutR [Paracidovorax wautersii]|uniref:HTH-type transcriptional regulator LutR n=1 Tax=Paracidovorax wautersii TaxID=1177982 RepID=A0A7V8JR06_9BURK|nr:MAG: HTH-type transcriptional regulator LutR [Paracidovorax wautersii]
MTVSFAPLKPGAGLADQVARRLETTIREGQLKPGDKLPTEAALVEQMGVSRTVVREALSRLKSLGLVESRQGSGVYVQTASIEPLNFDPAQSASRDAVIQIVEVRRALESEVAELAAQRRDDADLARIRQAVDTLADAVRAGRDGVEEDVAFHRAIAQASGNPFLISTLDYLAQFLRGATRVTRANEARRVDFASAVTAEHDKIVRAIESRDPAAARAAATGHMNNAITRIQLADPAFWAQDGKRLAQELLDKSR